MWGSMVIPQCRYTYVYSLNVCGIPALLPITMACEHSSLLTILPDLDMEYAALSQAESLDEITKDNIQDPAVLVPRWLPYLI
ncbi:hypothetical protein PILCRDRAFT_209553 [Piloderma croceum F 1598]|uniref:Uncharacterized protein n=1 Tax=Piloderma croceum (strain F 1598) TaxID=765440 RepID=A0A0C3GEI7_PILCF|nr:hypothetical protein PILCRDRAFT_209553 [Piloderma croceum F 1598]